MKNTFDDFPKEYLAHWKYIKRIKQGKTYRYFYTLDELKAFYDQTKQKEEPKNVGNINKDSNNKQSKGVGKKGKNANKIIDKNKDTPLDAIKDKAEKGKKWFDKKIHKKDKEENKEKKTVLPKAEKISGVDENGHKYIARVEINGTYRYFYSEDELQAYNDRQKYLNEEPDFMKDVKHSDVPYTSDEDLRITNPKFVEDKNPPGRYETNCAECTAIYELRRRGYDVESNGFTGVVDLLHYKYNTEARFNIMYENPKIQHTPVTTDPEETYKAIYKEINKNPPGSRGDISVQWRSDMGGGGHSMIWEKDSKGKIRIIDAQGSGQGYRREYTVKTIAYLVDNSSYGPKHTTSITRTDNLKLKKGITKIYQDSPDPKPKSKGESTWKIRKEKTPYYDFTTEQWMEIVQPYLDINKRKLTKKEKEVKYPVIGNKPNGKQTNKQTNKQNNNNASRIKALRGSGYTYEEIAKKLGISTSTISKYL